MILTKTMIDRDHLLKTLHTGMSVIECMQTIINEPAALVPVWVPVGERLPEHTERVLVACCTKKGVQTINLAYYSEGFWHGQGSMSNVTHWMEFPELPEVLHE